jgi:transposase-like protein
MEKKNRPKLPSPQERLDLILLGLARGKPVEMLCQEAGVSRELFYRWMQRVRQGALESLEAKAPGPKRVRNVEQASRTLRRLEERLRRLEQEAAGLRKERNHLQQVNQVARRIIRRQAGLPDKPARRLSSTSVKKNDMRPNRPVEPIANSGKVSEPWGHRCGPSAPPGASTVSRTGDGFGGRFDPNLSNDDGGSKTP